MKQKDTFRVPSRYMVVQRYGCDTYEILDGFACDAVVARGLTFEQATRWVWHVDLGRSRLEAERIVKARREGGVSS
jgi:hypothetical protein